MAQSDETLMTEVTRGQLDSAAPLFRRHQPSLQRFFSGTLYDRQQADDAVQEVFSRLLKYRATWRDEGRFAAWLYTLARNVARDMATSKATRSIPSTTGARDERLDDADPLAFVTAASTEARMRSALNALPADGREMLLLARLRELPYTDIAAMYGVSVSAVKMRIHRALVSLHEELNDESRHDL